MVANTGVRNWSSGATPTPEMAQQYYHRTPRTPAQEQAYLEKAGRDHGYNSACVPNGTVYGTPPSPICLQERAVAQAEAARQKAEADVSAQTKTDDTKPFAWRVVIPITGYDHAGPDSAKAWPIHADLYPNTLKRHDGYISVDLRFAAEDNRPETYDNLILDCNGHSFWNDKWDWYTPDSTAAVVAAHVCR